MNIELQSIRSLRSDLTLSALPVLHNTWAPSTRERVITQRQNALCTFQFIALCWTMFVVGWSDATTGPLIPKLQEIYHVNFILISLIFVFACVGFFSGSVLNVFVGPKVGFGKMMLLGACIQAAGHILQSTSPSYPLFVAAFAMNGAGMSIQDAQANGFVANYKSNPEAKMGFLHAAYGAGALFAPLVATQFAPKQRWSFHYLISLSLSALNIFFILTIFQLKTQEECFKELGQEPAARTEAEHSPMKYILSIRFVHLLAIFSLVYVGTEVAIGGWIVPFILELRGGGSSSGYISAGFFGGLMLGRIILLPVSKLLNEKNAIYLYILLALALEFVLWFVPTLISGGVSIALIGMLLGPIYPIAMNECSRTLPKWVLTGAMGWVGGFGRVGSAVLPLITGIVAEKYGIGSLQPLLVAMIGSLLFLWVVVGIFGKKNRED